MNQNAGISYNKLRQAIGWLGILLPLLVYLETQFVGDCHYLQDSISHYYYTVSNSFFVGILWGLGLVLLFYPTYKTDPKNEGILTSIAGLCSICVSLFPTTQHSNNSCSIFMCCSPWSVAGIRPWIHYSCAATMLLIFAYMSAYIFTKTTKGNDLREPQHRWKNRRNKIYRLSGLFTFASVLTIGILTLLENFYGCHFYPKYTFWLEVTALVPFGIAWLVKGGFILTDDNEVSTLSYYKNKISS